MTTCIIVGGGVIGLSLAYELSHRGWKIRLLEANKLGRQASWAGAGIFPPANRATALHPLEQLRALSHEMHAGWAARLRAETGIDTGYRRCGGLYLARTPGETAALAGMADPLREERIECRKLTAKEVIALEPALEMFAGSKQLKGAYLLPEECQLRNPRHLKALVAACAARRVEMLEDCEVLSFQQNDLGSEISGVQTSRGSFTADAYALAAGPWSQRLLAQQGIATGIFPMRGQMVLFRCEQPPFRHILNEGPRYLVPRDDGRVLAGSTEEEAGFDTSNTEEGLAELTTFATNLVPALSKANIEKTWAGLRPAAYDSFPYLGRWPGMTNGFVAAGHFRSGLHLSTGTALLLAQLMSGEKPQLDLTPFRAGRG